LPEIKGQPGRMDMGGAVTGFAFLLLLLLFVNNAQEGHVSPGTGALLLVAVVAGIAFFVLERRVERPMLNLDLFRNLTFSSAILSAVLSFMSQYVMVFITPFYLQRLLDLPADKVGLTISSFSLAVMAVAPFSGTLSDHIGTRTLASAGAAISAVSLFLMSRLSASATILDVAWRLVIFGLGVGIFQSPNNSAAMGSSPRPLLGSASGVLATARNVGMVFGIATAGAVLYTFVSADVLQEVVVSGPQTAEFLAGLRSAYLAGAALGVATAVTSLGRSRQA
jgi:MFS family permease